MSYASRSLTLLVADVLGYNPDLTADQQDLLARALKQAALDVALDTEAEANWFRAFANAGLQVTATFNQQLHQGV